LGTPMTLNMSTPGSISITAQWIKDHGVKRYAEVGVFQGQMIRGLLKQVTVEEYWAVDPWVPYSGGRMAKYPEKNWHLAYTTVCKLMVKHPQIRILRLPSVEAAALFPDGYFDMVYIDGNHEREEVAADIWAWRPKVREGGTLGGHDYHTKKHGDSWVKLAVNEIIGAENLIPMPVESRLWMTSL